MKASILLLLNMSLFAADTNTYFQMRGQHEHLLSWLPIHIKANPHLAKAFLQRQSEKIAQTNMLFGRKVRVDDPGLFYGTNCATTDIFKEDLLKTILADFEKNNRRPRVLEFGPGHGFFAENLIIAGADVTVVELQKNALISLTYNIDNYVSAFIRDTEKIDDFFYPIHGDVTQKKTLEETKNFNYIVGANVIHFFTPAQMDEFLKIAFDKLFTGGLLYISSSPPFNEAQWAFYRAAKENRYPGFMAYNPWLENPTLKDIVNPEDKVPGKCYGGSNVFESKIEVRNFFTLEILEKLLREQGFEIIETYYRDENNSKLNGEPANNKFYTTCAIARKPI